MDGVVLVLGGQPGQDLESRMLSESGQVGP